MAYVNYDNSEKIKEKYKELEKKSVTILDLFWVGTILGVFLGLLFSIFIGFVYYLFNGEFGSGETLIYSIPFSILFIWIVGIFVILENKSQLRGYYDGLDVGHWDKNKAINSLKDDVEGYIRENVDLKEENKELKDKVSLYEELTKVGLILQYDLEIEEVGKPIEECIPNVEYHNVLVQYATYNFEGTKYTHCKYFRNVKFVNGRLSDNLEIDIKTMGNNGVVLEYVDVTIEDETKRSYIGVTFPSGGIFTITDIL